jgi:hypothetical protein
LNLFKSVDPEILDYTASIVGAVIVLASGLVWRRMHAAPEAAKG